MTDTDCRICSDHEPLDGICHHSPSTGSGSMNYTGTYSDMISALTRRSVRLTDAENVVIAIKCANATFPNLAAYAELELGVSPGQSVVNAMEFVFENRANCHADIAGWAKDAYELLGVPVTSATITDHQDDS